MTSLTLTHADKKEERKEEKKEKKKSTTPCSVLVTSPMIHYSRAFLKKSAIVATYFLTSHSPNYHLYAILLFFFEAVSVRVTVAS